MEERSFLSTTSTTRIGDPLYQINAHTIYRLLAKTMQSWSPQRPTENNQRTYKQKTSEHLKKTKRDEKCLKCIMTDLPTCTSERNETMHWKLIKSWRDEGSKWTWLHHHHSQWGARYFLMTSFFQYFSTLHYFTVLYFILFYLSFLHLPSSFFSSHSSSP